MDNEFGAIFGLPGGGMLDLQKALEAGYVTDATAQVGGGALRIESLEQLLKLTTFQQQHIQLWKMIPKQRAFSTVEEFTRLQAYGQHDFVFQREGVLPPSQDADYARQAAFVKFLGVTREVSHPMTLVRTHVGDVMARENVNGILWILQALEKKLFFGQSNLTVGGATEGVEFNGLLRQIQLGAPNNIIDLANRGITQRDIRNAGQIIQNNFGNPTHMFGGTRVMEDIAKEYIPAERILLPTQEGAFAAGFVVDQVRTAAGTVKLVGDVFLQPTQTFPVVAVGPTPPNAAPNTVTTALAGATGRWAQAYPNGVSVRYRATFVNNTGETVSTQSAIQAIAVANLANRVDVTIENPGAGFTTAPTHIHLYRQDDPASTGVFGAYSLIARIPIATVAGAGTTVFADINDKIPNTHDVFMGQLDATVLEFKQLLDLVRMDLAVLAPAYRWMLLLYGTLIMYAPLKWAVFRNVKESS